MFKEKLNVVKKSVSQLEFFILAWVLLFTIWYSIFGVSSKNFNYYFSEILWTSYFSVALITHLIGLYFNNLRIRLAALYCYSFAWITMVALAAIAGTTAPVVPCYLLLFISTFYVIITSSSIEINNNTFI